MIKNLKRYFLSLSLGLLATLAVSATQAAPVNELLHQANDPVAGNPKGTVTIVEFFDYQCSHCIDMAPVMDAIIKKNGNVRVVFKDFPIRGPNSELAARAAIAASLQGKYYPLHHALLTTDKSINADNIYKIAQTLGIDVNKLKADMNSDTVNAVLDATQKLAQDLRLEGTPAFFIAKTDAKDSDKIEFIMGQMKESELQAKVNKEAK